MYSIYVCRHCTCMGKMMTFLTPSSTSLRVKVWMIGAHKSKKFTHQDNLVGWAIGQLGAMILLKICNVCLPELENHLCGLCREKQNIDPMEEWNRWVGPNQHLLTNNTFTSWCLPVETFPSCHTVFPCSRGAPVTSKGSEINYHASYCLRPYAYIYSRDSLSNNIHVHSVG